MDSYQMIRRYSLNFTERLLTAVYLEDFPWRVITLTVQHVPFELRCSYVGFQHVASFLYAR